MNRDNKSDAKPEAPAIFGNWDAQSKEMKTNYTQLTDEDLKFEAGKENELIKRVQTRLSKGREEVIGIIKKTQVEKVGE